MSFPLKALLLGGEVVGEGDLRTNVVGETGRGDAPGDTPGEDGFEKEGRETESRGESILGDNGLGGEEEPLRISKEGTFESLESLTEIDRVGVLSKDAELAVFLNQNER